MDTLAKRLKHARELAELSQAALAKRIGTGQSTIGSIESGRNQGSGKIVAIARVLGVRPEWLQTGMLPMRHRDATDQVEHVGSAPAQKLVAVMGQARLGENGWYDQVLAAGSEGYVEAVSNDPDAYVLRVVGDSMHPAFKNGWYVLVEPNRSPCPSDYVAVALTDGRKMVKEYLYRTDGEIILQSVNGGARLTLQLNEIATIHPISNLLSPGKHRVG